jgi:hypothetical protein
MMIDIVNKAILTMMKGGCFMPEIACANDTQPENSYVR